MAAAAKTATKTRGELLKPAPVGGAVVSSSAVLVSAVEGGTGPAAGASVEGVSPAPLAAPVPELETASGHIMGVPSRADMETEPSAWSVSGFKPRNVRM